jgi:hypothetical protein
MVFATVDRASVWKAMSAMAVGDSAKSTHRRREVAEAGVEQKLQEVGGVVEYRRA